MTSAHRWKTFFSDAGIDSDRATSYAAMFVANDIETDDDLFRLDKTDLNVMGIHSVGHVNRIIDYIKKRRVSLFVVQYSLQLIMTSAHRWKTFFSDAGIDSDRATSYAAMFVANDIETDDDLFRLDKTDLNVMGIHSVGHVNRIIDYIKKRKKATATGSSSTEAEKAAVGLLEDGEKLTLEELPARLTAITIELRALTSKSCLIAVGEAAANMTSARKTPLSSRRKAAIGEAAANKTSSHKTTSKKTKEVPSTSSKSTTKRSAANDNEDETKRKMKTLNISPMLTALKKARDKEVHLVTRRLATRQSMKNEIDSVLTSFEYLNEKRPERLPKITRKTIQHLKNHQTDF